MPSLVQLQAFVETVRRGTFAGAARALGTTQAGTSELVRRLERDVDVALFTRGRRELSLTPAGELYYPHASRVLAAADEGTRAIRSLHDLDAGHARFGILKNVDLYTRGELTLRFMRMYPNMRLTMTGQNSSETARAVASGHLEAGLIVLPTMEMGLTITPIAQDPIVHLTADPRRAARVQTIEQLARSPLALYDASYPTADPLRRQMLERAQLAGLQLTPVVDVEHLATALALVSAGTLDTIAPQTAFDGAAAESGIVATPLTPPMWNVLALVKRPSAPLSSGTRELVRLAYEALVARAADDGATLTVTATERDVIRFLAS